MGYKEEQEEGEGMNVVSWGFHWQETLAPSTVVGHPQMREKALDQVHLTSPQRAIMMIIIIMRMQPTIVV